MREVDGSNESVRRMIGMAYAIAQAIIIALLIWGGNTMISILNRQTQLESNLALLDAKLAGAITSRAGETNLAIELMKQQIKMIDQRIELMEANLRAGRYK